ncbi:hypothetical protein NL676_009720 [Syzygium grande]|nr:hypothetical protein NL676_009720 [Syzygium grande]
MRRSSVVTVATSIRGQKVSAWEDRHPQNSNTRFHLPASIYRQRSHPNKLFPDVGHGRAHELESPSVSGDALT